jgi:ribosomal protein L11 methyltransferase
MALNDWGCQMTRSKANPFAQSPEYWKVVFTLPHTAAPTAEESFNDMTLAVSAFETDEKNKIWTLELLCGESPDMEEIKRRLMVISALFNIPLPKYDMQKVEQQDWLSKVARDFPPITIGRFYVHGSHVSEPAPIGSVSIQVEAGAAFGSGEHGTTSRCLEAIDWLAKKRDFRNILDMGCGSGILGIAAAKLWKSNVLAVDIDPIAVRVTQENSVINRTQMYVTAAVSDGYASERVKRAKPFDLIVSNILARPLVAFAPDLAQHLSVDGIAVLSGLLTSQEAQVRTAHTMQGLTLVKRFVAGDWCTLVLRR